MRRTQVLFLEGRLWDKGGHVHVVIAPHILESQTDKYK